MLCVPLKTTNRAEVVAPLTQFIAKSFSADLVEVHQQAISHLQQLREEVRTTADKNEHTRELLMRYLALLGCVEKRFPINDENIRLQFVWFDAFKRKKSGQCSVAYEKACVLFNIASISSQIAEMQNRNNLDGIKKACHFFQLAAGSFEYLKTYILEHPQQASTPDLSAEVLHVLATLMLAQAQECFCEKAAKDGMSPSIISMLTAQAAEYYELVHTLTNTSAVQSTLDKAWGSQAWLKASYFKATANHSAAVALHAKDQYGEEVARLQLASSLISESALASELKKMPTEFSEWMNRLREVVANSLAVAERENNSVYHERVPPVGLLPKLVPRPMVKALPFEIEEISLKGDRDPFIALIPFEILQSVSIYNEKKAQLLRGEMQNIKEHNDVAKGSLGSMNLPAAIEAAEAPQALPARLKDRLRIVRTDGGGRLIAELIQTLQTLASDAKHIIDEAIQLLDAEEQDDILLRKQFGNSWTRAPSHALTGALRQEAANYRSNIEHAQKSDVYVRQKFEEHRRIIDLMATSEEEVAATLPQSETPSQSTFEAAAALRESLGYLDGCIAERNALEGQFKQLVEKDDISALLLSTQHPHEIIYKQELHKYEEFQKRLRNNFEQQGKLMEMISNEHARFTASKTNSDQAKRREQVLTSFERAYTAFSELKANLKEGIEFYTNFQDILKTFRTKCKDFAFARNAEKKDQLSRLPGQGPYVPPQVPMSFAAAPSGGQEAPGAGFGMPGSWQPHVHPVYNRTQAAPPTAPYATTQTYTGGMPQGFGFPYS